MRKPRFQPRPDSRTAALRNFPIGRDKNKGCKPGNPANIRAQLPVYPRCIQVGPIGAHRVVAGPRLITETWGRNYEAGRTATVLREYTRPGEIQIAISCRTLIDFLFCAATLAGEGRRLLYGCSIERFLRELQGAILILCGASRFDVFTALG